jgi:hypothetical protein
VVHNNLPYALVSNLKWNGFLSNKHELFYLATPKVACTSLKWWFANILGLEKSLFHFNESNETEPDLIIHDLFYKIAPEVTGLDIHNLQNALGNNKYFRFCLTKNPYKRIFSAWQSKWLLQEPLQFTNYVEKTFTALPVSTIHEIAIAFEGFLEYLFEHEAPNFLDAHVTPQFEILGHDLKALKKRLSIQVPITLS